MAWFEEGSGYRGGGLAIIRLGISGRLMATSWGIKTLLRTVSSARGQEGGSIGYIGLR